MTVNLPKENKDYSTLEYWEQRYKTSNDTFDWFKSFDEIKQVILPFINESSTILQLGCGNSLLSEELYKAGYHHIVNVDYSPSVIETMSMRCSLYEEMQWKCMDIFELNQHIEKNSFDVAMDKGTMDALLTVPHDPWNPPDSLLQQMHEYMHQIFSILKPNGVFLHLTFAQPHFRRRFLELHGCQVQTLTIQPSDASFEYFLYVCKRKSLDC